MRTSIFFIKAIRASITRLTHGIVEIEPLPFSRTIRVPFKTSSTPGAKELILKCLMSMRTVWTKLYGGYVCSYGTVEIK